MHCIVGGGFEAWSQSPAPSTSAMKRSHAHHVCSGCPAMRQCRLFPQNIHSCPQHAVTIRETSPATLRNIEQLTQCAMRNVRKNLPWKTEGETISLRHRPHLGAMLHTPWEHVCNVRVAQAARQLKKEHNCDFWIPVRAKCCAGRACTASLPIHHQYIPGGVQHRWLLVALELYRRHGLQG